MGSSKALIASSGLWRSQSLLKEGGKDCSPFHIMDKFFGARPLVVGIGTRKRKGTTSFLTQPTELRREHLVHILQPQVTALG